MTFFRDSNSELVRGRGDKHDRPIFMPLDQLKEDYRPVLQIMAKSGPTHKIQKGKYSLLVFATWVTPSGPRKGCVNTNIWVVFPGDD
jgi:hypothetical protein